MEGYRDTRNECKEGHIHAVSSMLPRLSVSEVMGISKARY